MALEKQTKAPETEGQRQHSDETASVNRRRLIKGAFAAPMILTLHSGAVAARSSNNTTIGPAPASEDEGKAAYCFQPGTSNVESGTGCEGLNSVSNAGTACDAGDNFCYDEIVIDIDDTTNIDNCSASPSAGGYGGFYATGSAEASLVMNGGPCP